MPALTDIRPSPIAGRWYPGDAARLAKQVDGFLAQAQPPGLAGQVMGLVAPHAGPIYSGRTAGHAFKTVQGQPFDLVVVASPLHVFHPAPLLTTSHQAYHTPLGDIRVAADALAELEQALVERSLPGLTAVARDPEHSLEIELPFLQRALAGEFALLPLMVRTHDPQVLQPAGAALAQVCRGKSVLLVASTDLSHFYPLEKAESFDRHMLAQIEALSPEGVLRAEATGAGFACGAGAVALTLWACQALGADAARILHYSTSADETHDTSEVVGYGAVAILKKVRRDSIPPKSEGKAD